MELVNPTESILVSFVDNKDKNKNLLVVGKKRINQSVEVINAFDGAEATELWNKLITQREKTNE